MASGSPADVTTMTSMTSLTHASGANISSWPAVFSTSTDASTMTGPNVTSSEDFDYSVTSTGSFLTTLTGGNSSISDVIALANVTSGVGNHSDKTIKTETVFTKTFLPPHADNETTGETTTAQSASTSGLLVSTTVDGLHELSIAATTFTTAIDSDSRMTIISSSTTTSSWESAPEINSTETSLVRDDETTTRQTAAVPNYDYVTESAGSPSANCLRVLLTFLGQCTAVTSEQQTEKKDQFVEAVIDVAASFLQIEVGQVAVDDVRCSGVQAERDGGSDEETMVNENSVDVRLSLYDVEEGQTTRDLLAELQEKKITISVSGVDRKFVLTHVKSLQTWVTIKPQLMYSHASSTIGDQYDDDDGSSATPAASADGKLGIIMTSVFVTVGGLGLLAGVVAAAGYGCFRRKFCRSFDLERHRRSVNACIVDERSVEIVTSSSTSSSTSAASSPSPMTKPEMDEDNDRRRRLPPETVFSPRVTRRRQPISPFLFWSASFRRLRPSLSAASEIPTTSFDVEGGCGGPGGGPPSQFMTSSVDLLQTAHVDDGYVTSSSSVEEQLQRVTWKKRKISLETGGGKVAGKKSAGGEVTKPGMDCMRSGSTDGSDSPPYVAEFLRPKYSVAKSGKERATLF